MANAVVKIRAVFDAQQKPLTLREITAQASDLLPNEVSMALCYLMRQRYVIREPIDNTTPKSRKQVWLYTYSPKKMS
jgi:hypothetical protein